MSLILAHEKNRKLKEYHFITLAFDHKSTTIELSFHEEKYHYDQENQ